MDNPKQPLKRKQADASAPAPQSNDNGDVLSSIMATMTENDALKTRGCVDYVDPRLLTSCVAGGDRIDVMQISVCTNYDS